MPSPDAAVAVVPPAPPKEPAWPPLPKTRGEKEDAGDDASRHPTLDDSPPCVRPLPASSPFEMRVRKGSRAGERALRVSLKNCARVPRTVHYESHSSRLSLDARAGDGGAVPITDTHANQKFDNTVYCLDVHRFLPGEERLLTDAQVSRVEGNLVVGVDGLVATGDREGSLEVRIAFTSRATKCREGFQERDAPWRPIADVWIGTVSAPPVVVP